MFFPKCAPNGILGVEGKEGSSLVYALPTRSIPLRRPNDAQNSTKCATWVAISKHGIIRSYWFEDENERAQTVLMKFWTSLGPRRGIDRDEQWFQQDGSTLTHQMTPWPGLESDLKTD